MVVAVKVLVVRMAVVAPVAALVLAVKARMAAVDRVMVAQAALVGRVATKHIDSAQQRSIPSFQGTVGERGRPKRPKRRKSVPDTEPNKAPSVRKKR